MAVFVPLFFLNHAVLGFESCLFINAVSVYYLLFFRKFYLVCLIEKLVYN